MLYRTIAISILLLLSSNVFAFDIREFVGTTQGPGMVKIIDPDRSIFGAELGTSEDAFIKEFGAPTGYIKITETETGMLYGKNHFFLFENRKLVGIRVSEHILDWQISKQILSKTPFDLVRWKLSSGIQKGMSKGDVKSILGAKLKENKRAYKSYYTTEKSKVELHFSHMVDQGENDEAYELYGIYVRLK